MKAIYTLMGQPGDTSGAVDLYEVVRGAGPQAGRYVPIHVDTYVSAEYAKAYAHELAPDGCKFIAPSEIKYLGARGR